MYAKGRKTMTTEFRSALYEILKCYLDFKNEKESINDAEIVFCLNIFKDQEMNWIYKEICDRLKNEFAVVCGEKKLLDMIEKLEE